MTPGGGHVVQGGVGRCPVLRGAHMRPCGCSRWTDQVGNMPSNVRQWDFGIKVDTYSASFIRYHNRDTPFMIMIMR